MTIKTRETTIDGFRYCPGAQSPVTSIILIASGLALVVGGVGVFSALALPGQMGMALAAGGVVAGFGALLAYAGWRRPSMALCVLPAKRQLVVEHLRRGALLREELVAFDEITSIFHEAEFSNAELIRQGTVSNFPEAMATLVIKRNAARDLRLNCTGAMAVEAQIELLDVVMGHEAPPEVQSLQSLIERAGWELRARAA